MADARESGERADGNAPPDLGEAIREVGAAARAGLKEAGSATKAFRTLLAADVSLARSAFGRAMALTGVAIVFGASCWLLLMAALIVFLSRQLGLPWAASLLICALLSGVVTVWAAWRADRYFDHTRMQATRRQLARLGIGELSDFTPNADSSASSREQAENLPPQDPDGKPPHSDVGVRVTPAMKTPHQNVTFEQLIAKVKHAEDVLEARERRVTASYARLKQVWREGWTPLRIVAAGLVSGFLVGRAEPLGAVGGARILQMVTAVSSLFASAQASVAAGEAKDAADDAGEVAADAADVVQAPAASADRDPAYMAADDPMRRRAQAAEAATELSER